MMALAHEAYHEVLLQWCPGVHGWDRVDGIDGLDGHGQWLTAGGCDMCAPHDSLMCWCLNRAHPHRPHADDGLVFLLQ